MKERLFTCLLDEEHFNKLDTVATIHGITKAALIRHLIDAVYKKMGFEPDSI